MRVLVLVLPTLAACGLLTVSGPGEWSPSSGRAPVCDASAKQAVAIDGLAALFAGVVAVIGVANLTCGDDDCGATGANVGLTVAGLGGLGLLLYSIRSATTDARLCRAAIAEHSATR